MKNCNTLLMNTIQKESKVTNAYLAFLVTLSLNTICLVGSEIFLFVLVVNDINNLNNVDIVIIMYAAVKLIGLLDSHIILFQEDHVKNNKKFHIFMLIFSIALTILAVAYSIYSAFVNTIPSSEGLNFNILPSRDIAVFVIIEGILSLPLQILSIWRVEVITADTYALIPQYQYPLQNFRFYNNPNIETGENMRIPYYFQNTIN